MASVGPGNNGNATAGWQTDGITGIVQVFVYLQVLDLITTLIGFRMGAAEASPFIRALMHAGPSFGVIVSKFLALGIGAICVYADKFRALRWLTFSSAVVVVWNLLVIFNSASALRK